MASDRRLYTREFKLAALARLDAAPHVGALAAELGVRRELLYKWRVIYVAGGADALRTSGRPRPVLALEGVAETVAQADSAQRRIAELEGKIGRQQIELDFFRAALRHVREQRGSSAASGATASTR